MNAVNKYKFKKIRQHFPEIYPPSLFAKEQLFYWFPKVQIFDKKTFNRYF